MELLLIRHARPLRVQSVDGPADPGLSPLGRRQAEALAAWLAAERIDAVYTSPLRRAVETAAPLGEALGVAVTSEAALAEYDAEATAYIPIEDLRAAGDPRWMEVPDDIAGFQARVGEGVDRLAAAHPSQRIAFVCHGGVINVIVSAVLGVGPQMLFLPAYTSISRVLIASTGQRSLASLNETGHLRTADVPLVEL
ncbi:MAG TPA: histidine phosphatase family protein [Acidimicrobiales bacterium]|jgi:broad specificity phosphatase PhoE|nr:histidine phosphatase family protein [Acidimicrobiales bacterium]